MKSLEKICRMSQKQLKAHLTKCLETHYNEVVVNDGYIYAKGSFPVLLVAHMDTVHSTPVLNVVYEDNGNKMSSPQGIGGDDRCGIYSILEIIKDYNCSVLFTEDEEVGCKGALKFTKDLIDNKIDFIGVNYMIELDRKGNDDAVFYECDNPDFEEFIFESDDWNLSYGTFTDIVELEPIIGVAGVNFSCGYYNAHTTKEYIVISEMLESIEKVKRLLDRTDESIVFDYIEAEYAWYDTPSSKSYSFTDIGKLEDKLYYILAEGRGGSVIETELYAVTEAEALGLFLMDHPDRCYNDIVEIFCEE